MRESYPKCFGVKERMDGKGRELTIGRTNEMSGKILQVMNEGKYMNLRTSFRNFMLDSESALQQENALKIIQRLMNYYACL